MSGYRRAQQAPRPRPAQRRQDGRPAGGPTTLLPLSGRSSDGVKVASKVPEGSRRAWDQASWLRAITEHVEAQGWWPNRTTNYLRIYRHVANKMDWADRTSSPGHHPIAAKAGCSVDTVARAMKWAQDQGFAGLVSPGTTERLCPLKRPRPPEVIYAAVLRTTGDPEKARRAALPHALAGTGDCPARYVLTVPRRKKRPGRIVAGQRSFADLSPFCGISVATPGTYEGERSKAGTKARAPRGLIPEPRTGPGWRLTDRPQNRSDGIAAAAALQDRFRLLGEISTPHVRSLMKFPVLEGWLPSDFLRAIDPWPGGAQHRLGPPEHAGHVPRWIRWRLAHWITWRTGRDDDPGRLRWIRDGGPPELYGGTIGPSASQRRAAKADQIRAGQARQRAENAERSASRAADQAGLAARARELLAEALSTATPPSPAAPAEPPTAHPPEVDAFLRRHGGQAGAEHAAAEQNAPP